MNPVRATILLVGRILVRGGVIDETRLHRTVDLAWPRIVTGLARMSKNAVDIAMVGLGVGPVAIAGVGFAGPYWGSAFTVGSGLAAGTIALVSQRYGAGAHDRIGVVVRASVVLVLLATIPIGLGFRFAARPLIGVLTNDAAAIDLGATYLRIVALGVPLAALNLIGSRALIGADDAWTPMVVRGGGAVANIVLSGWFIFGLGWGVAGAAWGTVLANVLVLGVFVIGLTRGRVPGIGAFPITVRPTAAYWHRETIRDIIRIGVPVLGRNGVWTLARFPMLAIVALFGPTVVAAYIISRRLWGLMNTPGWGFGLAASSLVGQSLGTGDESTAAAYGRDIVRLSVASYAVTAAIVIVFAEPIVLVFLGNRSTPEFAVTVPLVYAAAIAVIPQGIAGPAAGALDATGDTTWPFYSRVIGMFVLALPMAYLGATTALGIVGLYLAYGVQTVFPAAINYYRFRTGKWKAISRQFRPPDAASDD